MSEIDTTFDIPQHFKDQIRECLSHLYDYAFLQDHPIVHSLTPSVPAAQRVQAFRQIIIDTIEHFSPGIKVDFHSRQARTYNILLLRYIEGHEPPLLLDQLALSERQFYREHRRATESLSRLLWERIQQSQPAEPDSTELDSTATTAISLQSEIQRVFSKSAPIDSDLNSFLFGISTAIYGLAEQHQAKIEIITTVNDVVVSADFATLRQFVILVVARLLQYVSEPGRLIFEGEIVNNGLQITVGLHGRLLDPQTIPSHLEQQETLQYLLEALDGTVDYPTISDNLIQLSLRTPLRKRNILIIDDNPDVIDLFKRYLAGQSYQIYSANEGQRGITLARDEQPELIVLDVMLPGTDGWELLQNFKNHPSTKHIPVLICSVLDAPDVAFSLGANDYLRKPPGRADFLTALARWQD